MTKLGQGVRKKGALPYLSEVELVGPDQPEAVEGEGHEQHHQHEDNHLVRVPKLG